MSINTKCRFTKYLNRYGFPITDTHNNKQYFSSSADELVGLLNSMNEHIEELEQELEDAWLEMKEQDSKFDI